MRKYKIQETTKGFDVIGENHSMNGNSALYHTSETLDGATKYLKDEKGYSIEKEDITMLREMFEVTEEEMEDYTGYGPWDIGGETYTFVDEKLVSADGEGHDVTVQRESDGKFFQFGWLLSRSENYYFNGDFKQVFKKEVVIITYE